MPAAIVVVAKAPRPGAVKTRLIPHLGAQDAADLAARMLQDTVAAARRLAPRVAVAYAPDDGREAMEPLLGPDLLWIAQRGDDLGARMEHAARGAAAAGCAPLILMGADSPTLSPDAVSEGFGLLESTDLALGPSEDGGVWCIGLRRPAPGLFDGIAWSTAAVFAQLKENALRRGLRVGTLATGYDIDTVADLDRLRADPHLPTRAPVTAAWLDAHPRSGA